MNLILLFGFRLEQLVWMKVNPQPKQDPARNAQIYTMDVGTRKPRRLFTEKEQLKYSNAMPVISPVWIESLLSPIVAVKCVFG